MKRVVITGLGAVSTYGIGVDVFWESCLKGQSNIQSIPDDWFQYADFKSKIWSPLPKLDYLNLGFKKSELKLYDNVSLNAILASKEALSHSGFSLLPSDYNCYHLEGLDSEKAAVFMGTGQGGAASTASFIKKYYGSRSLDNHKALLQSIPEIGDKLDILEKSLDALTTDYRYNRLAVPQQMINAAAASVGIKFGLHGPVINCSQACASGTTAIGQAFKAIKGGQYELAIAGGSESLNDGVGAAFKGFDIAGTLATDCEAPETANRPFDKNRSGFLFSEGGASVLILEELEHARERNAPILAEVLAYEETFDAHNMMAGEPDGKYITQLVKKVADSAGEKITNIDYFNTHGTGTVLNDAIESEMIKNVLPSSTLINSTKSLLGHTIGASGAFEAMVTALSIKNNTTHISKNVEDPIAKLNFVNEVKSHNIKLAYSHSLAFGGHNAGIMLSEFNER